MAHFLVTGGCGFIGSHLVDALLRTGNRVRVIDDLSTGDPRNLAPAAELIRADAADPAIVAAASTGVDGAFHLAAVASVARCHDHWSATHRVNLGAMVALLEAAASRGRARFPIVYASSSAVYGDSTAMPLQESDSVRPRSAYGVDKHACELHALVAASVFGVASLGLRFFNVYGPRQRDDDAYAGVIAAFARGVARGLPLSIHGDGNQTRDFIYVGDVVVALLSAMNLLRSSTDRASARVLNICTGRSTSICELAKLVMALGGRQLPIHHGPVRAGDIQHSVGSPDAAQATLAFRATTPLSEGLRGTLAAWQQASEQRWPTALTG